MVHQGVDSGYVAIAEDMREACGAIAGIVPTGVAGAAIGLKVGAAFGPAGMVIGAVVGNGAEVINIAIEFPNKTKFMGMWTKLPNAKDFIEKSKELARS